MSGYDDIINLPHHRSETRAGMPRAERAAQFSSFAALTGYEDGIEEAVRLTDGRLERSEEEMRLLDFRLNLLCEQASCLPEIEVLYFVPDPKKQGGSYRRRRGTLRRVDLHRRVLIFTDKSLIPLDDIYALESGLFPAEK